MRDFFRPIRRTLGVLVLIVACGVMGIWVRSWVQFDLFQFRYCPDVVSVAGQVRIYYPNKPTYYAVDPFGTTESLLNGAWTTGDRKEVFVEGPHQTIPHWSIVLSLTLLAAYLLIGKPRPPKNRADVAILAQRASDKR